MSARRVSVSRQVPEGWRGAAWVLLRGAALVLLVVLLAGAAYCAYVGGFFAALGVTRRWGQDSPYLLYGGIGLLGSIVLTRVAWWIASGVSHTHPRLVGVLLTILGIALPALVGGLAALQRLPYGLPYPF